MTYQLEPIIITPEQITAAASRIANQDSLAWQYTEGQYLAAVEHWLRCKVNDILADADWHALVKDHFDADRTCEVALCTDAPAPHGIYCKRHSHLLSVAEAKELVMPQPPAWAFEDAERATGIIQRPEIATEPDGDVLWI